MSTLLTSLSRLAAEIVKQEGSNGACKKANMRNNYRGRDCQMNQMRGTCVSVGIAALTSAEHYCKSFLQ